MEDIQLRTSLASLFEKYLEAEVAISMSSAILAVLLIVPSNSTLLLNAIAQMLSEPIDETQRDFLVELRQLLTDLGNLGQSH